MHPFYDENYYFNDFNPQMYPMNPQFPINKKMRNRENLRKTIHYATRTIYTINQIIPLIYQIRPIINNTKNAFRVINAVSHINDIDFDEVENSITPIEKQKTENNQDNNDVTFENMIQ